MILETSLLTTIIIVGTFILSPFLVFGTYKASGFSLKKNLFITGGFTLWALTMLYILLYLQFQFTNPLIVPILLVVNLVWPSIVIFIWKDFFVGEGLSLKWLTGLQVFRNIGGLFLLENINGYVGTEFAYAAGIGDIVVGVFAIAVLIQLFTGNRPSNAMFYTLILIGVLDFISAFTFGFLSSSGTPFNFLAIGETHLVNVYPLGLIPFLLVPLAMAYHWMMFITVKGNNH